MEKTKTSSNRNNHNHVNEEKLDSPIPLEFDINSFQKMDYDERKRLEKWYVGRKNFS